MQPNHEGAGDPNHEVAGDPGHKVVVDPNPYKKISFDAKYERHFAVQLNLSTQRGGHRELHHGPILKTNIYENFVKIKILDLNCKANAPIHRYKTSRLYYPVFSNMSNLGHISVPVPTSFQSLENSFNKQEKVIILWHFLNLENLIYSNFIEKHLAVWPNHEMAVHPNFAVAGDPNQKKLY